MPFGVLIVSGGEPSALMQEELRMLSDEERNDLLEKSGISTQIEISAEQGLAIKAGLSLPWFRLRHLKRFDTTCKMRNSNELQLLQMVESFRCMHWQWGKDATNC